MSASLRELGLRVVAVANQKGGVGKTASVISLASGLARRGDRVLVVDGDPQGNLSLSLGRSQGSETDKEDLGVLLRLLSNGEKVNPRRFIEKKTKTRLDLIPMRSRKLRTDLGDLALDRAAAPFSLFLQSLRSSYDWLIIDCSPSNGMLERTLIRACEAVVIPLEFQLFSVSGLEALLADIAECSILAGRIIRPHALIFTKAEARLRRVETYRAIFSSFRIPIFEVCKSEYLPKSVERGKTIWESAPMSCVARDYARILDKSFLG